MIIPEFTDNPPENAVAATKEKHKSGRYKVSVARERDF